MTARARSLAVAGVRLSLGGRILLGPLSFTVGSDRPTTVMGPSGSGKSSLLSWLTGTLPAVFAAEGRAVLDGRSLDGLPPERRRLGILFQDDLLFPHLTVGENLAFAIPAALRDRKQRRLRVHAALAESGLEGLAERDPATLSGGQRARVALLRTLLCEPLALLLDEPFNKLDGPLKERFRRAVFETARDRGLPVLMVSHDPADAAAAAGPVVTLRGDSQSEN